MLVWAPPFWVAPIATPSLLALSGGAINQDIAHLPANKYRMPSYPFVADLTYTPKVYGSARNRPNFRLEIKK